MARTLGRLHALTRGATPVAAPPVSAEPELALVIGALKAVGMGADKTELAAIWRRVTTPEYGFVLCHWDAAPRNYLMLTRDEGRLIDFELADAGHPFLDAFNSYCRPLLPGAHSPPMSLRRQREGIFGFIGDPWSSGAEDEFTSVLACLGLRGFARGQKHGGFAG